MGTGTASQSSARRRPGWGAAFFAAGLIIGGCSATDADSDGAVALDRSLGADSGPDGAVSSEDGGAAADGPAAACAQGSPCVQCGDTACPSPGTCCGGVGAQQCVGVAECAGPVQLGCDDHADCASGRCCVAASAPYGPYAPDDPCAAEVSTRCAATCEVSASQTSSSVRIKSGRCSSDAECVGVRGSFGVPYPVCCRLGDLPGVCVSETYAEILARDQAGWTCDDGPAKQPDCLVDAGPPDAGPPDAGPPDAGPPPDKSVAPTCSDLSGTWSSSTNACWSHNECTFVQVGCAITMKCGWLDPLPGTVSGDSFSVTDGYTACHGERFDDGEAVYCVYKECIKLYCGSYCPGPMRLLRK